MNAQQLQASAQRLGVVADPRAARPFRLAAVRLSDESPDSDAHRVAATEAAALLVGLALADAEDDLRRLLTPDPIATEVIWTVACYQIGDLTPSAIRDFPDPVDAVATVAACPDEGHIAAELVASTAQGLRWTAVLRTNDLLSFQLPSPDTASDASRERPGDLAAALKRWRQRLSDWSAHSGHERDTDSVGFAQLNAMDGHELGPAPQSLPTVMPSVPAPTSSPVPVSQPSLAPSVTSVAFNERFSSLEQRLARLETSIASVAVSMETLTQSSGQIEKAIDARFRALASVMHNTIADLGHNVAQRVDSAERRMTSTVRDSASDTVGHVRELDGWVSAARRSIETSLREEIATVLTGMRAGLTPLTNEVVQRVGEMERDVESDLAEAAAELRGYMTELAASVEFLQQCIVGSAVNAQS